MIWWIMRHSRVARWFFKRTVTEFIYDLELVDAGLGYTDIKRKWMKRLNELGYKDRTGTSG